ncbi:L1P family protein [Acanthamoeba castellanii str. Neff]|uniref:L1P family protein n=1 Tax=Acanthamoeba castellanii (strain ATCC 30010 / Neff) TaxID=1257118 RepID=L8GTR0_ACACF|nr:L1P family protein [Acanthamoeba castellanii str. Neff]ELR16405.1 L1P family protein [Acanthamoeba castellanii str. Neff]
MESMIPLSLPAGLQLGIWTLLDRKSLCNASLVCRAWHALSSDNHLWKEMCRREITEVEWTPRALARNHKSWKRHFGVRLRAVDPLRAGLHRVVPQLLDDARHHGATTDTVALSIQLYYDPSEKRTIKAILPHAVRHMESSSSRATIGVIGPSQCLLLREQAKELGVDFFDLDHLRAFNKNWKQIKKWALRYERFYAHGDVIRYLPRILGSRVSYIGRFPKLLPTEMPLAQVLDEHRRTSVARFRLGHADMRVEQLRQNVEAFVAALAAKLPSWDGAGSIQLHATRGPSFAVYVTHHHRQACVSTDEPFF